MKMHQVPELIAYCYFDGKMEKELKSQFEVNLCNAVIDQITNTTSVLFYSFYSEPAIPPRSLALFWIYFDAHARHVLGKFIKVKQSFSF